MTPHPQTDHRYIGENLTASYDGWHIWLTTPPENGSVRVALTRETLPKLLDYARQLFMM